MACTGTPWPSGATVSGETLVVTCTACRDTTAFKTAQAKQHPPDATQRARNRVDAQVQAIRIDRPRDLDPELAEVFSAVATGVRECSRLMASVPHLWVDESEYRRLAASVADAATAASVAYMAVDIRLRRAGGPNPLLETLNDVLTVQGRAPADPTGTPGGVNAILTNLCKMGAGLFRTVDGRKCIDRMLDQVARVPPATPRDTRGKSGPSAGQPAPKPGKRQLTSSNKPADIAKVNAYMLVGKAKEQNPHLKGRSLREHFANQPDFKARVKEAGETPGKKFFRAAEAWLKRHE